MAKIKVVPNKRINQYFAISRTSTFAVLDRAIVRAVGFQRHSSIIWSVLFEVDFGGTVLAQANRAMVLNFCHFCQIPIRTPMVLNNEFNCITLMY